MVIEACVNLCWSECIAHTMSGGSSASGTTGVVGRARQCGSTARVFGDGTGNDVVDGTEIGTSPVSGALSPQVTVDNYKPVNSATAQGEENGCRLGWINEDG